MVVQENNLGFVQIQEGGTKLLVPLSSLTDAVPSKNPAFFNRLAKLNRDMSILAYRAFALGFLQSKGMRGFSNNHFKVGSDECNITFADALSGTGARALRVAVEAPEIAEVHINDINQVALEKSKVSAAINNVIHKCQFSNHDVNKFLIEHETRGKKRFMIADLDPFGSPTPYIDSLLRSVRSGGLISVTATDTAVLSGVHPKVCLRKYFGMPINNGFSNETGIRLLVSLISKEAARFEFIVNPIFVHANMHYLRVYLTVERSSSKANAAYKNLGFILYCFKCGDRMAVTSNPTAPQTGISSEHCKRCADGLYTVGGPVWSGNLFDKEFVKRMNALKLVGSNPKAPAQSEQKPGQSNSLIYLEPDHRGGITNDPVQKILNIAMVELDSIPYYFKSDEISSYMRINPSPITSILEKLGSVGFNASRTSLNPTAFKTNANLSEIIDVLK
jgi:tRNA (guanine26-N2/guanine27-N2)-dimethyltransferase